jgi:Rrf2 family transcriptional regulator, iron-sulfur cluster assembly transcription factor
MLAPMTGYATTALAWLAARKDGPSPVNEIAESTGVPAAYLSKIMHRLGRLGLVDARRGVGGGVLLSKAPSTITLYELAEALNDPLLTPKCMLGVEACSDERNCPCHSFWKAHRLVEIDFLHRTTIADLCQFEHGRGWTVQATIDGAKLNNGAGGDE